MPLFELTHDSFRPISEASFTEMQIRERADLQRLLRTQIDVLDESLYVLAEEFGDWEDSSRRIDLLAVDSDANLVVIELKRTHDGGHMELQAIRYASMVSAMTFERAVDVHGKFLAQIGEPADEAESRLLEFLGWDAPNEDSFGSDVRIVLVSENFGKELTTAVLWLRDRDIDIRCIRLRPYRDGTTTMVDVQQIIPLPEAQDYTVRLREKEQEERVVRRRRRPPDNREFCEDYWTGVLKLLLPVGIVETEQEPMKKQDMRFKVGWPDFHLKAFFSRAKPIGGVWLDCRGADGIAHYEALLEHRDEIEATFGEALTWTVQSDRNQGSLSLRFASFDSNDRTDWERQHRLIADRLIALYRAVQPFIESLAASGAGR